MNSIVSLEAGAPVGFQIVRGETIRDTNLHTYYAADQSANSDWADVSDWEQAQVIIYSSHNQVATVIIYGTPRGPTAVDGGPAQQIGDAIDVAASGDRLVNIDLSQYTVQRLYVTVQFGTGPASGTIDIAVAGRLKQ